MTSYLDAGRTGLITTIKAALSAGPRTALVGFGSGSPGWDGGPAPVVSRDTTALSAPFAYVTTAAVDYAKLRSEIVSPTGLPVLVDGVEYDPVLTPTPLLMIRAILPGDFASAVDLVIREVGISLNPTFEIGVGAQQTKFLPGEVDTVGQMLIIRRMAPIPHDGSNSGTLAAFLMEI